jgi:hypothetical protein
VQRGLSAARLVSDSSSRKEKGCLGRKLSMTVAESSLARGAKQKVSATRFRWSASMRLYALACLRENAYTSWFGARAPRRKGCS